MSSPAPVIDAPGVRVEPRPCADHLRTLMGLRVVAPAGDAV